MIFNKIFRIRIKNPPRNGFRHKKIPARLSGEIFLRKTQDLLVIADSQHRHKSFLRKFDAADGFHAFFAGFLLFEQLSLA